MEHHSEHGEGHEDHHSHTEHGSHGEHAHDSHGGHGHGGGHEGHSHDSHGHGGGHEGHSHDSHGHGHHNENEGMFYVWIFPFVGAIFLVILFKFFTFFLSLSEHPSPSKVVVKNEEIVAKKVVHPGEAWITPPLNFKFRFHTDQQPFDIQFQKKKGGWSEKMHIPAEGKKNLNFSSEIAESPAARITCSKFSEQSNLEITLYKE